MCVFDIHLVTTGSFNLSRVNNVLSDNTVTRFSQNNKLDTTN